MAWIVFWEPATGGYRIQDNNGARVEDVSCGSRGAIRHAEALQQIEELKIERDESRGQFDDVAAKLEELRDKYGDLEARLADAEAEAKAAVAQLNELTAGA